MMSPIAIKSAIAAQKRAATGEVIKGSGRRRTVYTRPAVVDLIRKCGSIQALGRLRGGLAFGAFKGTVKPSEKTEREWERAFWGRVIELMLASNGDPCPTFIYNHQLRWHKSPAIEAAVQAAMVAAMAALPSPAERLRAQGITIEGITSL